MVRFVVKGRCKGLSDTLLFGIIHNILTNSSHGIDLYYLTIEDETEEQ